jgi:hypothetical protein
VFVACPAREVVSNRSINYKRMNNIRFEMKKRAVKFNYRNHAAELRFRCILVQLSVERQ